MFVADWPVDKGPNLVEPRLFAIVEEPVRVGNIKNIDFGQSHHPRLLPVVKADRAVP